MKNKKGISLIMLVITIIVMIILAAAVVVTLSNTGIINKADDAVTKTDKSQVTYLATLIWSEEYMGGKRGDTLKEDVLDRLKDYTDDYNIDVTDKGVTVTDKTGTEDENEPTTPTPNPEPKPNPNPNPNPNPDSTPDDVVTLGSLIKSGADYGKKINYVSDNGLSDWRVFYKQKVGEEEYVYLIPREAISLALVPQNIPYTTLKEETVTLSDNTERKLGFIHWYHYEQPALTIQNKERWMAEWRNYDSFINARLVTYLLNESYWTAFTNTEKYKDANGNSYVLGAIGSPTLEMFIASWNQKGHNTTYTATQSTYGYVVNSSNNAYITEKDDLYVWNTAVYSVALWLASPSQVSQYNIMSVCSDTDGKIYMCGGGFGVGHGLRPLVCLNANIPATEGDNNNYII